MRRSVVNLEKVPMRKREPQAATTAAEARASNGSGATVEAPRPVSSPAGGLRLLSATSANHDLLTRLAADLGAQPVGIAWIYGAIAEVVGAYGLDDCILVVGDSALGRQVFRHGRRPLHDAWGESVHFRSDEGLHAHGGNVPPDVSAYVCELARVALKLDALSHAASHDLLTGLLNRRAFDEMLASDAAQAQRYSWEFALVLIDVDGFKAVNDRLGHPAGDGVLRLVGAELRRALRAGDVAARIGGDEFALVVAGADASVADALRERLTRAVAAAIPHADISFSFGVACAPREATEAAALLRIADKRLYDYKGSQ